MLWRRWLGARKIIRPVIIDWWGVGAVICLVWRADSLHMVQLMPLHLHTPQSLASLQSRLVLPFWYRLAQVVPVKRLLNVCSSNKHTHTHPFNGPLSGTTRVSRYQKGKTSMDFTEARDSEWQWHQSAPCCRQITTPAPQHSVFYRPDALPAAQPTASKHWRCVVVMRI